MSSCLTFELLSLNFTKKLTTRLQRWTPEHENKPLLVQCWPAVYDVGPTLNQQWLNLVFAETVSHLSRLPVPNHHGTLVMSGSGSSVCGSLAASRHLWLPLTCAVPHLSWDWSAWCRPVSPDGALYVWGDTPQRPLQAKNTTTSRFVTNPRWQQGGHFMVN